MDANDAAPPAATERVTDPLWFLAAKSLTPHIESTRKRGWIDGFVAGLDAACNDTDLGPALRASIGLEVEVEVAIRQPMPKADIESLARFMFERQAVTYESDEETINNVWDDPGVKDFWMDEARAVMRFLP